MVERIKDIRKQLAETAPLIHCITNPISINQCANLILASGGRPIMAEHPQEVQEITRMSEALLLNLGNITDVRLESIILSADEAQKEGIPYVFDAVGIACSELRRTFTYKFLEQHTPAVIKGNYSEIHALYNCTYRSSGVDADTSLDPSQCSRIAKNLAGQYHCVILASGKTDIVTDGTQMFHINNGTPMLAGITGTGCMLGALCACYLAADQTLAAAAAACAVLGICGERSVTAQGTGSFMVNLMDRLSVLTDKELEKYIKMEEIRIEDI